MDSDAIALLACPVCGRSLAFAESRLACESRHSFDLARHGYVNLLAGAHPHTGDDANMVAARERFLAKGHYDPIAEQVGRLAADHLPATTRGIADVGGGTGWLLSRVLERIGVTAGPGICLDLSPYAARRAARVHPRIISVVSDAWGRLPLADARLGVVLSFFAPRNPAEFHRVLASGGAVILVTPAPDHLAEARDALGLVAVEPAKDARIASAFASGFETAERAQVRFTLGLTPDEMADLVAMGPSAHHRNRRADRTASLLPPCFEVTVAVNMTVLRRV